MKRYIVAIFVSFFFTVLHIHSAEIFVAAKTSVFAFTNEGNLNANTPIFGGMFRVTEQITDILDGVVSYDSDPVSGNTLSVRGIFRSSFLEINAGPSFGVLNTTRSSSAVSSLFQSGLGIGFSLFFPGILVASADSEFALPPAVPTEGQVYLQKSSLSARFFLPNVVCTFGVRQRTASAFESSGPVVKSLTDYGFYTESFKKGSMFRANLDFIYRILDYYEGIDSDANRKIGNIVLGAGLTWAPSNDLNIFIDGSGALYTFSLKEKISGLDKFLYEARAGAVFFITPDDPSR